jgi:hypothetical protein
MVDANPVACGGGNYKDCKITKKVTGGAAANYEFECTTPQGQKKKITTQGATLNDNAARQQCCNGEFD